MLRPSVNSNGSTHRLCRDNHSGVAEAGGAAAVLFPKLRQNGPTSI
jgi:hypothetical protein